MIVPKQLPGGTKGWIESTGSPPEFTAEELAEVEVVGAEVWLVFDLRQRQVSVTSGTVGRCECLTDR